MTEREKLVFEISKYSWAYDENGFNGEKIVNFILADRKSVVEMVVDPLKKYERGEEFMNSISALRESLAIAEEIMKEGV